MAGQIPRRAVKSRVRLVFAYTAAATASTLVVLVVLTAIDASAGMSGLAWSVLVLATVVALVVIAAAWIDRGRP